MRKSGKFPVILLIFILFTAVAPQIKVDKNTANENQTKSLADELNRQAKIYAEQWSGESVRRSIEIYNELSEKYKSNRDFKNAAQSLIESARLFHLLEEFEAAEAELNAALKLNKYIDDENIRAETLSLLSLISLRNGKISESEKLLNQAKQTDLPDGKAKATVYSAAAELDYVQRDLSGSIKNCLSAIDQWRKSGNVKEEIETLRLLAYAYISDDDLQNSIEILDTAVTKARQHNLRREEALAEFQTGLYYLIINQPQKALEICRHAEMLFPDDMDFIEKARLMSGIATIYSRYGDLKTAIYYKTKAYELFEKGNYQLGELATMSSLVEMSFLFDDEKAAFDYLRRTEILAAKLKDRLYLAHTYKHVADYYDKTEQDEKAIELYLKSLKSLKEAKFLEGVAQIENSLGKIYARRNNFEFAEKYFQTALERSRKIRSTFSESETLFNLAQLRADQNNDVEALKFAHESVKITENLSANAVNAKLKIAYFSNVFQRYDLYIKMLMKMNEKYPEENYAVRAFQVSENSRARRMLEYLTLSETDFIKDAPEELVKRETELRNLFNLKTDKLSGLLSRNAESAEISETENEIRELENELEELLARLKQSSPIYTALKNPAPFEIAELQEQILDENTVLLEFSLGDDASYLWKIGKNDFSAETLPPRQQIESKVRELRELLAENEFRENETIENYQARVIVAEKEFNKTAENLSKELFGKAAENLAGKRLIVVADGFLHYFPVSALPMPNSTENKPILLTNEVVYQPSASLLMTLRNNIGKKSKAENDLLVFADPVFSTDDVRLNKKETNTVLKTSGRSRFFESLESLARLTASKDEANAIINIVGAANSRELSGFDANRENFFKTDISEYKILHFATHGLINEERPEFSGIVLSRFDQNGGKINESIRLQDIYALNLKSDLVVLSACNTGIGKDIKGEGLMSLNNAFLQSGSKSVVSSLWKVDDFAALELMKNFYREMSEENASPSDALRSAQIKMWENPQYKSPFYWAAFTFHGDFQNKPEFSGAVNYTKFYALFSVIFGLVVILGSYFFFKKRKKPKSN